MANKKWIIDVRVKPPAAFEGENGWTVTTKNEVEVEVIFSDNVDNDKHNPYKHIVLWPPKDVDLCFRGFGQNQTNHYSPQLSWSSGVDPSVDNTSNDNPLDDDSSGNSPPHDIRIFKFPHPFDFMTESCNPGEGLLEFDFDQKDGTTSSRLLYHSITLSLDPYAIHFAPDTVAQSNTEPQRHVGARKLLLSSLARVLRVP